MTVQSAWDDAVRQWATHHDTTAPRPVAERLAEQEATIQRLIAQADEMGREIERLREALDFYANPEHWDAYQVPNAYPPVWESGAAIDGGERARRALNVEVGR